VDSVDVLGGGGVPNVQVMQVVPTVPMVPMVKDHCNTREVFLF
jgi:hypothetical protein